MNQSLRILLLCTGNSCRRQMAEGWANHLKSEEGAMAHYRRVRDEIRFFVESLPESLHQ